MEDLLNIYSSSSYGIQGVDAIPSIINLIKEKQIKNMTLNTSKVPIRDITDLFRDVHLETLTIYTYRGDWDTRPTNRLNDEMSGDIHCVKCQGGVFTCKYCVVAYDVERIYIKTPEDKDGMLFWERKPFSWICPKCEEERRDDKENSRNCVCQLPFKEAINCDNFDTLNRFMSQPAALGDNVQFGYYHPHSLSLQSWMRAVKKYALILGSSNYKYYLEHADRTRVQVQKDLVTLDQLPSTIRADFAHVLERVGDVGGAQPEPALYVEEANAEMSPESVQPVSPARSLLKFGHSNTNVITLIIPGRKDPIQLVMEKTDTEETLYQFIKENIMNEPFTLTKM